MKLAVLRDNVVDISVKDEEHGSSLPERRWLESWVTPRGKRRSDLRVRDLCQPFPSIVNSMTVGIFAIVGVVLGSVSTYLVQTLMAGRAEDFAMRERLRRERMDAYSAFAAAAMEARRSQINRWYQRRDAGRGSAQYDDAKAESYRGRSAARLERYRLQLVADDDRLTALAETAIESLGDIHQAETKSEMEARAEGTRTLVEQVVGVAAAHLSAGHGGSAAKHR